MLKPLERCKLLSFSLLVVFLGSVVYLTFPLPDADWYGTYYPAIQNVLAGKSPYNISTFSNPPWIFLLLIPFGLFPLQVGRALFFIASVFVIIIILWKTRANILMAVAFFLSPTLLGGLLASNPDAFVVGGILLPPTWGLFVLILKPQIAIGVVLFTLIDVWKQNGLRVVVRTFAPVTIAICLTLILFPIWPEQMLAQSYNMWNRSAFPYLIPLGIFLMWLAFRHRNPYFSLAASLFFAPHHTLYSLIAVQIGLMHPDVEKYIRRDILQIILTLFFWFVTLYFKL